MALFSNPLAQIVIGTDTKILYFCECKELKPVSKLYFCKHCTKLRCADCVTHEVDSFYCPNCLENMPSAEAKLKKNRCGNCFDCPSCSHTLSVRGTTLQPVYSNPLEEMQKDVPVKKVHYLHCTFCKWTTRDVGLPDQITPSGGWPEKELPFGKPFISLLNCYKQIAHEDKMERERQKITKRRNNVYIMERYGYAVTLGKKGALSSIMSRASPQASQKNMQVPVVSEVIADIEPLPDSYYTQSLDVTKVLSLDQRLLNPGIQPHFAKDLYPKHKHLMVRRSQRCQECEHNIFKPEFNPSSIKFKIQLGCIQYCPIIQIVESGSLIKDEPCKVVLSITNPLDTIMNIRFEKVEEDFHAYKNRTANLEMPTSSLPIAAKDATVEIDGIGSSTSEVFDDDPSVIESRNANKVCIFATVQPLNDVGEVIALFKITYEYKMVTTLLVRKGDDGAEQAIKPEEHLVSFTIYAQVNFGEINQTLC